MLKRLKKLLAVTLVSAMSLANIVPVFATTTTTPTVVTSTTYDVGTGKLNIKGTNLLSDKANLNLKGVIISDGLDNSYTLTTPVSTKNSTSTTTTAITVALNAADMTALAKFLDNCTSYNDDGSGGYTATTTRSAIYSNANSPYLITFLKGWDGTSSPSLANQTMSVSDVAGLSSASYDCTSGTLTIKGTNLQTGASFLPKDLTITDGANNSYTLTSPKSSTSAIVLSKTDQIALKGIFTSNTTTVTDPDFGTKSLQPAFFLNAAFGWAGPTSIGTVLPTCPISVANYKPPVVTGPTAQKTVVIGSPLTGISTDTPGTIYVITTSSAINLGIDTTSTIPPTSTTKAALDLLVKNGTALSAVATAKNLKVSIPTKGTAKVSIAFNFATTKATDNYDVVEISDAGVQSNLVKNAFTINNVAAPALTAAATAGSASGTTVVNVTSTIATGDVLAYEFSTATIATPKIGLQTTTFAAIAAPKALTFYSFKSGDSISGVASSATTDKYLGIYELSATGTVVKFKLLTLTAAKIKPPTIKTAYVDGTKLTLVTDALNTADVPSGAFKVKNGTANDAVTNVAFVPNGNATTFTAITLTLTTPGAIGCSVKYTKPSTGYLQDSAGNAVATQTLTAIAPTAITAAITGVTVPVTGETPVTTTTGTGYTATITWNTSPATFAASTAYTATITITPSPGYTLSGVTKNFFTVSGATESNDAASGVVTAVFTATGS